VLTINPEAGVVLVLLGERRVKVMGETFCSAIFQSSASVCKGPCASFWPTLTSTQFCHLGPNRSNEPGR
jgi:hypothetical protein